MTMFSHSQACGGEQEFPGHRGKVKSGFPLSNFIVMRTTRMSLQQAGAWLAINRNVYAKNNDVCH